MHSENKQETKTLPDEIAPRPNMRTRAFQVGDTMISLPQNHIQYKAPEACSILLHIESTAGITLTKAVNSMINYRVNPHSELSPLIPVSRSSMFHILSKYRKDPDVDWPVIGQPPILSNQGFIDSVFSFEKDKGRAVGKKDFKSILLSLIMLLFYGGMIYGVLPSDSHISFEAHLSGLVAAFSAHGSAACWLKPLNISSLIRLPSLLS